MASRRARALGPGPLSTAPEDRLAFSKEDPRLTDAGSSQLAAGARAKGARGQGLGLGPQLTSSAAARQRRQNNRLKSFAKGQDVEAVILGIDPHKERISLGIKQLSEDVFDTFAKTNPKGTELTGEVSSIGEDIIFISLAEDVTGKIKNKEVKDNLPAVGDSVTSLVTSIDRKNRQVNLSIFALEKSQEKELIKENISKNKQIESETKTSIGDLIQEELSDSSKD